MGFFINEIRAYRNDGVVSRVSFSTGLNLVVGPSNTGKTRVANTIDYLMGGSEAPFVAENNYVRAELDLVTDTSEVLTISRELGSDHVRIEGTGSSDDLFYLDSKKTHCLDQVLLPLLGLTTSRKIIKNTDWHSQALTWRSLYHLFWISETYIDRPKGTVLRKTDPTNYVTSTPELCTMLVVGQGENYDEIEANESDRDRRTRQRSVKDFAGRQIAAAYAEDQRLQTLEEQYKDRDLQTELETLSLRLTELRRSHSELVAQGQDLTSSINVLDEEITTFMIDASQRIELISQLTADLERLHFIEKASQSDSTLDLNVCAYCHQSVEQPIKEVDPEALQRQRHALTTQLDGAQANLAEIQRIISLLKQERNAKYAKYVSLQDVIREQIIPAQNSLNNDIKTLKEIAGISGQRQQIQETITRLSDMAKNEPDDRPKFKPLEKFDQDFFYSMRTNIRRILTEVGFASADAVTFDEKSLDVRIGMHEKNAVEGKGYAAFLNTVVLIAYHEYLQHRSDHAPGFLLIDSPLKNFDDSHLDPNTSMRSKLLHYLARTAGERQIILCENSDRLIGIDLDDLENTNIIRFTKDQTHGRYGYLEGVYEPGEQSHD